MEELKGAVCESCGKEFTENDIKEDQVVYCPVCGAPAHRSCWNELGGCPFEERHAEGFEYHRKVAAISAPPSDASSEAAPNRIPVIPMPYQQQDGYDEYDSQDENRDRDGDGIDELRRFIESRANEKTSREKTDEDYSEKKYDGVSEKEMMCFLNVDGPQKLYRLAIIKFMIMSNKKASFNLFSGLLNPYNQFYKGMTFLGVILTLFNYIMGLPQLIAYYLTFFKDTAQEAAETASTFINESALLTASNTLWLIQLTVVVLLCVFGDYLFILFMLKKIKKIRSRYENEQSEEYLEALAYAGRPRIGLVVMSFILQAFLSLLTLLVFVKTGI